MRKRHITVPSAVHSKTSSQCNAVLYPWGAWVQRGGITLLMYVLPSLPLFPNNSQTVDSLQSHPFCLLLDGIVVVFCALPCVSQPFPPLLTPCPGMLWLLWV